MPRSSAVEAQRTAQRVLDAAVTRFLRDGYAATSVDDIARDAGVTRGAVYHHYRDKEGLLGAVVDSAHSRVAAGLVERSSGTDDPLSALRLGCHAFVDLMLADPASRLVLVDGPAVLGWSTWRRADAARSEPELRHALTAAMGGDTAPSDVEAAVQLLSGAMNQAVLWLADRDADARATSAVHRTLELLVDAVVSGRRADPAHN